MSIFATSFEDFYGYWSQDLNKSNDHVMI
jgi:hypothetical protein